MRRRLDLAAALVHRPPVLFLDEPTTGLDPRGRIDLWGVIEELVADGATLLLTTQYLEEADRLADRIAVIDHGRVIAEGTAAELKARLGSTIIQVELADAAPPTPPRASWPSSAPPTLGDDGRSVEVNVGRQRAARCSTPSAASTPPASSPSSSPSASRASTTCSCPSPVAPPIRHRRRGGGHLMAAVTAPAAGAAQSSAARSCGWAVSDAITIAWRNLKAMSRTPEMIVFSTIQPIIFVLTFRYVFGGAIARARRVPYVDFLMPGIFVQTVAFGAMNTGVGLAEDLHKGLIERFRSLPMARSAVLAGRTLADLVRNVGVVMLMIVVGFLVGFRIQAGVLAFLASILLLLLFALRLLVDLRPRSGWRRRTPRRRRRRRSRSSPARVRVDGVRPEGVDAGLAPGLQRRAAGVGRSCEAMRALSVGGPTRCPVLHAVLWCVAIVAVFVPLAVRQYRKTA